MPLREQTVCTCSAAATAGPSRRRVLGRGILLGFAGAAAASPLAYARRALASVKMAKQDAGYHDAPRGGARCDRCVQFQPPEACNVVQGTISPSGSCDLFAPKPH